jgi:hypothetical protein
LSTAQVNDVRFSYFFLSAALQGPLPSDCFQCLGLGAPSITVRPDLFIGTSPTDTVLGRRYQLTDVFTWQTGTHTPPIRRRLRDCEAAALKLPTSPSP